MAAGFFNAVADPAKARGAAAGTDPADRVHPVVVDVMAEVGIDLREAKPQRLTAALAAGATLLVTMGCGESCPYIPDLRIEDWALADPKGQDADSVRRIRDDIRERVLALVAAQGWTRYNVC